MNFNFSVGGSAIVNPFGSFIAGPTFGEETILYTNCHANHIKLAKATFDVLGHYTRWDTVRLQVRKEAWVPEVTFGDDQKIQLSNETMYRICEENGIPKEKLETIIREINESLSLSTTRYQE
jgi:amidase/nitrilase